jgi:cysteine desulfurase/selenocysteine lyase
MMEKISPDHTAYWTKVRNDFPILQRKVNGVPLVYLDNAATSQKPQTVIDSLVNYYSHFNANVHRGVHTLSQEGTDAFENARNLVKDFIHAATHKEIIFTKGTTSAVNLVAYTFAKKYLHEDDEILITEMEHHSNIVPWQLVCEEKKARLKVIQINNKGELDLSNLENLITDKTKLISIVHVSNALGTINPVKQIIDKAHLHNIPVLLDGAQSVPHMKIDVQDLNCDFYCFSGHKMLAPTGIGILYGKEECLNKLSPFEGGGEMIDRVTFEKTTFNELPFKFEAGTPNIEGAIGLGTAIDYLNSIGMDNIAERENYLYRLALDKMKNLDGFQLIGDAQNKSAVLSFIIEGVHPYDMGVILDKQGIAVRTGHHCTQPLMDYFNIPGTIRASFSFYNNEDDVESLYQASKKAIQMLR